jgi:hypothetical protein
VSAGTCDIDGCNAEARACFVAAWLAGAVLWLFFGAAVMLHTALQRTGAQVQALQIEVAGLQP